MSVRRPAVAGLFYSSDRDGLLKELDSSFLHPLGPGRLPEAVGPFTGSLLGIVSPHAGYMYSGPVAAHGYLALSRSGRPDVVFIMGPNHQGIGSPLALSEAEEWETPLGTVEVDREVSRLLMGACDFLAPDEHAHRYEHSVEVQVPFLQRVFEGFSIVPIVMLLQNCEVAESLGRAMARVIEENGLRAYIVASTDFTHYEPDDVAKRKDRLAIEKITALDHRGLYDAVVETPISMCGPGPVMTLIVAARELGATRVTLYKYATSGDVVGERSAVVGYASLGFERVAP